MNFLLSDENKISSDDYEERENLYKAFMEMPMEFLSKMRHFQPQQGCPIACSFCSKFSGNKIFHMDENNLRNVISALKYAAMNYRKEKPYLVWDREEHRSGVVFPYLDNDIGNYPYLDKYIELLYNELGIKTRISTVTYSRNNKVLNDMHIRINKDLVDELSGVRISLAPFGRVWEENDDKKYSFTEYCEDISNFLETYKPYYDKYGSGSRDMCVELRYKPLAVSADVYCFDVSEHKCIATGNYLFISVDKNVEFEMSHIADPLTNSLNIDKEAVMFKQYALSNKVNNEKEAISLCEQYINSNNEIMLSEVYLFENKEGIYYAIDPKIKSNGNYGINIYPTTEQRNKSGYIITERFLLNALYSVKKEYGLILSDNFVDAKWKDAENIINALHQQIIDYKNSNKMEKAEYIKNEVIPLVKIYITALKKANYEPSLLFNKKFTIDTGMICNLGRAFDLFKDLTSLVNEPMTPANEKNYGQYYSKMKVEDHAWRLSCYDCHNIIIEKLDLSNTASKEGQNCFRKIVPLVSSSFINDKEFYEPNNVAPGGIK